MSRRLRAAAARLELARGADERRPSSTTALELERAERAYERAATDELVAAGRLTRDNINLPKGY